jgi:hypothetical protein
MCDPGGPDIEEQQLVPQPSAEEAPEDGDGDKAPSSDNE